MNSNVVSVECYSHMCSACTYEDCACRCHLRELLDREPHYREPDQLGLEEEE
jgi:hypothetical protein